MDYHKVGCSPRAVLWIPPGLFPGLPPGLPTPPREQRALVSDVEWW